MSLHQRRVHGDLIETYKLITIKVDASQFFDLSSKSDTRGHHSLKIVQKSKVTPQDTVLQSKSGGNFLIMCDAGAQPQELFTWRI